MARRPENPAMSQDHNHRILNRISHWLDGKQTAVIRINAIQTCSLRPVAIMLDPTIRTTMRTRGRSHV